MLKQGTPLILLLILSTTLASCSTFFPQHKARARLPSRQQLCTQLKHQIVFQNNPMGPTNANNITVQNLPTEQARLQKEYDHYNCNDLDQ